MSYFCMIPFLINAAITMSHFNIIFYGIFSIQAKIFVSYFIIMTPRKKLINCFLLTLVNYNISLVFALVINTEIASVTFYLSKKIV